MFPSPAPGFQRPRMRPFVFYGRWEANPRACLWVRRAAAGGTTAAAGRRDDEGGAAVASVKLTRAMRDTQVPAHSHRPLQISKAARAALRFFGRWEANPRACLRVRRAAAGRRNDEGGAAVASVKSTRAMRDTSVPAHSHRPLQISKAARAAFRFLRAMGSEPTGVPSGATSRGPSISAAARASASRAPTRR
jgi:hypothetical protein